MKPVVKVLLVVFIVLVVVHTLKYWMSREDEKETYIPWIHQEFETVPPMAFAVTPSALTVSDTLTAQPVLAQVDTGMPTVSPTMVPAFVSLPTAVPTIVPTARPMVATTARPA